MSRELILLLGGARSGKSAYAKRLATQLGEQVLYVATARAEDEEMRARIAAHRRTRPPAWQTLEAPTGVGEAIRSALAAKSVAAVLLDCLTLLVSNVILKGLPAEEMHEVDQSAARERVSGEVDGLLNAFHAGNTPWIVVSNVVGWGLVPPSSLGRIYRDLLGQANQRLAAAADRVYLMVAGLPLDIKGLSIADPGGPPGTG